MEYSEEVIIEAKKQLTLLAIKHIKKVDARTLTILQKNKIFESLDPNVSYRHVLPILCNTDHPSRITVCPGPLFFYLTQEKPPTANIVNLAELLFATNVDIRKASFDYFYNLEDEEIPLLTTKSRSLLKTLADKLFTKDEKEWRDVAVAIYDTLNEDWYFHFAALRQCLQRNFIQGIEEYLTKVIRPSIPSVDSVTIGMWEVSKQKEEILQVIDKIVEEAASIEGALNQYFFRFGHLPFRRDLSIINLIDKWQSKHGGLKDIWAILWNWADSFTIPLPRYHVCMYFVSKPDLVSNDKYTKLWHEIIEVIYMPNSEEEDLEWTQSWRMLCENARHYCYHLETRLPFMNGERIASQAWWLAVQVCKLFSSNREKVKHLRNETFIPELASSSRIWKVASPAIEPSSLRFLTINTNSLFSLSLQAVLGNNLDSLRPSSMDKDDHQKFEHTISGSILGIFPPKIKDDSKKVYVFEDSILLIAKKWLNYIDEGDKNKEMINAFIFGIEKLIASDDFESIVMKFMDSHSGDQVLIANYLKNMIFTEEFSPDTMWKAINDPNWRETAFRKSHPFILELIYDALNEIETRYQNKWAYNLPHYYALELEKTVDPEKKKHLFACVIHSSLCGNSVSAIQRLLKGENKHDYQEEVDHWRKRLGEIQKWAPELVKARIRPIFAALYI